jgi:hypothetical protein
MLYLLALHDAIRWDRPQLGVLPLLDRWIRASEPPNHAILKIPVLIFFIMHCAKTVIGDRDLSVWFGPRVG